MGMRMGEREWNWGGRAGEKAGRRRVASSSSSGRSSRKKNEKGSREGMQA